MVDGGLVGGPTALVSRMRVSAFLVTTEPPPSGRLLRIPTVPALPDSSVLLATARVPRRGA
ncbi:hypothetical protein GCM10010341_65770 [Streptomyces noursei]|nr:hypothetical protein GCM10010341_65770 [Streptomyces noursei]